jgi:hypothetical protein
MEIVLLVFINIIMAAVFYVILRFKLEKYASDYRERRLKREMDEIIVEFNETAERNISILESRIEILKKLLEQSSKISNIDLSADENIQIKNSAFTSNDADFVSDGLRNSKNLTVKETFDDIAKKGSTDPGLISRYFSKIKINLEKTYNTVKTSKHSSHELYKKEEASLSPDSNFDDMIQMQSELITVSENSVKKRKSIRQNGQMKNDLKHSSFEIDEEMPDEEADIEIEDINASLSEKELEEMFSVSEDKYLLISDLYSKGYASDVISRCSGIPIGEIKLVLDLNNTV